MLCGEESSFEIFSEDPRKALERLIEIGDNGKQYCMISLNYVDILYNPFEPKPLEDLIMEYEAALLNIPDFNLVSLRKRLQIESLNNVIEKMYNIDFKSSLSVINWVKSFCEGSFPGMEIDNKKIVDYFNQNMILKNSFADYNLDYEVTVPEYRLRYAQNGIEIPKFIKIDFADAICSEFVNQYLLDSPTSFLVLINSKAVNWIEIYS